MEDRRWVIKIRIKIKIKIKMKVGRPAVAQSRQAR